MYMFVTFVNIVFITKRLGLAGADHRQISLIQRSRRCSSPSQLHERQSESGLNYKSSMGKGGQIVKVVQNARFQMASGHIVMIRELGHLCQT